MEKKKHVEFNYSAEQLKMVKDEIHTYPIEEQAWYANPQLLKNIDKLDLADLSDRDVLKFEMWDARSVGSVAYLSLNHKDEKVRDRATYLLRLYKEWKESNTKTAKGTTNI